jgi:hypothetical protein
MAAELPEIVVVGILNILPQIMIPIMMDGGRMTKYPDATINIFDR